MIETMKGKRYIKGNVLVSGIAQNLLSVGQRTEHVILLLFEDNRIQVYDDRTLTNFVVSVQQTRNRCVPLSLNSNYQVRILRCV